MTATTEESTAMQRYLDAVRAELADLADAERVDVLDDVQQHLLEVAAEGDESLESKLGPPAAYAAELRAAAGLPPRPSEDDPFAQRLTASIMRSRAGRDLRRLDAAVTGSPTMRRVREFLPELRPGWWVLRGYLVAAGLAAAGHRRGNLFVPAVVDNFAVDLVIVAGLIYASVAWARYTAHHPELRQLTIGGNVAVVLASLVTLNGYNPTPVQYVNSPQQYDQSIVRGPYGNILNIYPYAADGTPLKGVLLYDQDGRPVPGVVMDEYSRERGFRDATGMIVPNMFPYPEPLRDPNTGDVVGERQRPVIVPPTLQTPIPSDVAGPSSPAPAATASAIPSGTPSASAPNASAVPGASASPNASTSPSEAGPFTVSASTPPASTAPASTAPASTAPASTAPASSAPAASTAPAPAAPTPTAATPAATQPVPTPLTGAPSAPGASAGSSIKR